jgi:nucleoside diphosphate kinase
VLALELAKDNAVEDWIETVGPLPIEAKLSAFKSLRAQFGTDNRLAAVTAAESEDHAKELAKVLFELEEIPELDAVESIERSLVVLSPLLVNRGLGDLALDKLTSRGFQITKREEINLTQDIFAQLYPGMLSEQQTKLGVVYTGGPVVAVVVQGEGVISQVHEMVHSSHGFPAAFKIEEPALSSSNHEDSLLQIGVLFPIILNTGDTLSRPASAAHLPMIEQTLAIIKPDAYASGNKDKILDIIKSNGFKLVKEKELQMSFNQAQEFYKEHNGKPFFEELTVWMSR